MITAQKYERQVNDSLRAIRAAYERHLAGDDMKSTNESFINSARSLYEFCLQFKGQEEAE